MEVRESSSSSSHSAADLIPLLTAFRHLCHNQVVPDEVARAILGDSHPTFHATPARDAFEAAAARHAHTMARMERQGPSQARTSREHQRVALHRKMTAALPAQTRVRRALEDFSLGRPGLYREVPISYAAGGGADAVEAALVGGLARRARPVESRQEQFNALVAAVPAHFLKFTEFHAAKYEKQRSLARACQRRVEDLEHTRVHQKTREEEERLKLLKSNNYAAYVQHVKESKNAKLSALLDETDTLLQTIGSKVAAQQRVRVRATPKVADAANEADGNEADDAVEETTGYNDYYGTVHQMKEEVTEQPSSVSGGKLMGYQVAGVQWMISLYNNKLSGILADEQGTGKTVQTIATLAYLQEKKKISGPHLVIIPLSTLPNWVSEFDRWWPTGKVVVFKGTKVERKSLMSAMRSSDYNVCLTTYDYILREKHFLSSITWKYVIVDEGHRLKNAKSKLNQSLLEFRCSNRLLLTGTPLSNNLEELWTLLNFVLPRVFSGMDEYEEWFGEPLSKVNSTDDKEEGRLTEEEKLLIVHRLHAVLRPFLLRRVKADVLKDLPDKEEYVVRVELSEWQKRIYDSLTSNVLRTVDAETGKVSTKAVHNTLMQLRKCVNHPYLFENEYAIDELLFRCSGKFEVLDRILPKMFAFGHKVLIFCQMTNCMDILSDFLDFRGWAFYRLDGKTTIDDRRERMALFNGKDNDEVKLFILSTRAGALGLNLQASDTVVIFDSDFNPQQDLQAQDRVHRHGQKSLVKVIRLVTRSPVERLILDRAMGKLDLDMQVIQAGMFNRQATDEDRRSKLKEIFRARREEKKSGLWSKATSPEELNRLLARSTEEYVTFQQMDEELLGCQGAHVKEVFEKKDNPLELLGRLMDTAEVPAHLLEVPVDEDAEKEDDLQFGRGMRKRTGVSLGGIDRMSDAQWLRLVAPEEVDGETGAERPKKKRKPTPKVQLEDEESVGVDDLEEGDRVRLVNIDGNDSESSGKQVHVEIDFLSRDEVRLRYIDGCSDDDFVGGTVSMSPEEFERKFKWELLV